MALAKKDLKDWGKAAVRQMSEEEEKEQRRRRQVMSSDGQDSPGRCVSCGRTAGMVSGANTFSYLCGYCDGSR